jgi:hypothetical protein
MKTVERRMSMHLLQTAVFLIVSVQTVTAAGTFADRASLARILAFEPNQFCSWAGEGQTDRRRCLRVRTGPMHCFEKARRFSSAKGARAATRRLSTPITC